MTYRPQPKYASRDARDGPWTTCSDCGFIWSQCDMQFQYDFMGGSVPQNTGWLRCPRCITPLTFQRKMIILPPDPPPIMNTRPEPYAIDETNFLTTQDGTIFQTVNGQETYITSMPNPEDNANTSVLSAILPFGGALSVAYFDIFYGDPLAGGTSVLEIITGSATRTNLFSQLEDNGAGFLVNPEVITITTGSQNTVNVTHVAIYDSATGGVLITSGPVSATFPTVAAGTAVQFDQLTLQIATS